MANLNSETQTSVSFGTYVSDIMQHNFLNPDDINLLCGILVSVDEKKLKLSKDSHVMTLAMLISETNYSNKILLLRNIMDATHIRNLFESQLKIIPIYEFIQYYGITPWDCYLNQACKANNMEFVSVLLSRGAQYCSHCCNTKHTDNIKKILNDVAQFILDHSSEMKSEEIEVCSVNQVVLHEKQCSSDYAREHCSTRRVKSSKRILRLAK